MNKFLYKSVRNKELKTLEEYRKGSWVYCANPTNEDLEQLATTHNLDLGILRDALDEFEAPRFEVEEGIRYIFTRFPYEAESNGTKRDAKMGTRARAKTKSKSKSNVNSKSKSVKTATLLIAQSEDFTITISSIEFPFISEIKKTKTNTTQKTKFLLDILKIINKSYEHQISKISKQIKEASSNLENIENRDIVGFVELERVLNDFLYALAPTNIMLERIIQSNTLTLFEDDEEMVEDLTLSNNQLIEISKSNLKFIVNVRESYTTILSNKLNKTMKLLTSITIILTIPTIVFSFYGMNVNLPIERSPLAYIFILFGTFGFSAFLAWVFSKKELF